ncbi:MAG: sensor histidine kinase [Nibricoccus sp.]
MTKPESRPATRSNAPYRRLAFITLATALLLVAVFVVMVVQFRSELRDDIRQKIIGRDAAVLYPVALQQVADAEANTPNLNNAARLTSVFKSAKQRGMLGVAVFDEEGGTVQAVPATMLFVDLPADDYLRLLGGSPISRFHPAFPLDRYFAGMGSSRSAPVLEVLLPLFGRESVQPVGFVRYYIDAQLLAAELTAIDQRVQTQTTVTLAIGTSLIIAVLALAYFGLQRAQKTIAHRNDQLTRANFELTLAAKASALGQITSHLIHGLQGSVAGLRSVVASHDQALQSSEDWQSAAGYTERMQTLIQETVGLLGDVEAQAQYELSGNDLAETIRQRSAPQASRKGVILSVRNNFNQNLDSHRGSLVCLITSNLVENAIVATPSGRTVDVALNNGDGRLSVLVSDQGSGIPDTIRNNLFQPGRSTKPGGTGLGLAISHLIARQIRADLTLAQTGPTGTSFKLTLPLYPDRQ